MPEFAKLKRMQESSTQAYNSCLLKYWKIVSEKKELKREL